MRITNKELLNMIGEIDYLYFSDDRDGFKVRICLSDGTNAEFTLVRSIDGMFCKPRIDRKEIAEAFKLAYL